MDTPILVAIISGIFGAVINPVMKQVVIPMIISLIEKLKNTFGNKRVTIFLQAVTGFVLFFVFFGILAYFLIKPTFLSPCPLFASTSVTITSPAPESKVPLLTIVQGSADYIPPDTQLWLLVVPDGGTSFFPQPGPIVVSSDGKWSASAYIGLDKPGESGKGHVVYAALADQEGSTAIQNYFKSRYKPLDPLPRGIQLMSQVHVVRE